MFGAVQAHRYPVCLRYGDLVAFGGGWQGSRAMTFLLFLATECGHTGLGMASWKSQGHGSRNPKVDLGATEHLAAK